MVQSRPRLIREHHPQATIMHVRFPLIAFAALALAGCVTNISDRDDTIVPSKAPFGQFQTVRLKPVAWSNSAEIDNKVTNRIDAVLSECMRRTFKNIGPFDPAENYGQKSVLLIEPIIVEAKKVSSAQRVFLGALAGSSAALLEVKYTDYKKREVIADPTFFQRANAMGGAWTFGATDNDMLSRLPNLACQYSAKNM